LHHHLQDQQRWKVFFRPDATVSLRGASLNSCTCWWGSIEENWSLFMGCCIVAPV
jgi:hypothetical protein